MATQYQLHKDWMYSLKQMVCYEWKTVKAGYKWPLDIVTNQLVTLGEGGSMSYKYMAYNVHLRVYQRFGMCIFSDFGTKSWFSLKIIFVYINKLLSKHTQLRHIGG